MAATRLKVVTKTANVTARTTPQPPLSRTMPLTSRGACFDHTQPIPYECMDDTACLESAGLKPPRVINLLSVSHSLVGINSQHLELVQACNTVREGCQRIVGCVESH